jgi:1-phosphatidylinositol-4-phosphate 5-kinase
LSWRFISVSLFHLRFALQPLIPPWCTCYDSPGSPHTDSVHDASEADLSYGNASLQEQLLEQNVELHQQQYAALPAPAPAEVIFNLNAKHQFRDFRPATFRKLRQMCNLSEDRYLELISQPTKERLSEGASGAFFFYCGEGELVVKTVAKHEGRTLLKILDRYLSYLQSRPDSLLVRFLGLHSISMYGNEFNFVVMKNIFPPRVRMNDKYDIKGSWVGRHAQRKDPGKRATCKYCNESFLEGSADKCPEVVGGHEAVMTLKDSDMVNKIRLYPDHAYALIDILNSDSDALCAMGMMDYSLLVGVKTQQYDVDSLQLSQQGVAGMVPEGRLSSFSESDALSGGVSAGSGAGAGAGRRTTLANAAPVDVSVYSSIYSTKHANSRNSCSNVPFESRPTIVSETSDDAQMPPPDDNADTFISPGYPARAVVAPSAYYLGVIDVLQTWSWSKRLEHLFKVYVLQQPAAGLSCVPPEEYKKRYQKKMVSIIEHSIFIREVTGSWRGKR